MKQNGNNPKQRDSSRLAFGVESMVLVAVLLVVCTVLVQVFSCAAGLSRKATDENNAVQLCRNAAQALSAAQTPQQAVETLGAQMENGFARLYYDGNLQPTEKSGSVYTLQIAVQPDEQAGLYANTVTVLRQEKEIYSLYVKTLMEN